MSASASLLGRVRVAVGSTLGNNGQRQQQQQQQKQKRRRSKRRIAEARVAAAGKTQVEGLQRGACRDDKRWGKMGGFGSSDRDVGLGTMSSMAAVLNSKKGSRVCVHGRRAFEYHTADLGVVKTNF